MRLYTVQFRRRDGGPEFVLIKEGFSWPALFLSALWALWKRLWLVAFGLFAASVALGAAAAALGLGPPAQGALSLGLAVVFGFVANDLRRWTLGRRGFTVEGVVGGGDEDAALRRFLDGAPDFARSAGILP